MPAPFETEVFFIEEKIGRRWKCRRPADIKPDRFFEILKSGGLQRMNPDHKFRVVRFQRAEVVKPKVSKPARDTKTPDYLFRETHLKFHARDPKSKE